jgi:hypothetical protein
MPTFTMKKAEARNSLQDAGMIRDHRKVGERTNVPFRPGLPFDNLGEGGDAAESDIVIRPTPGALAMAMRRASGSRVSSLALRLGHE